LEADLAGGDGHLSLPRIDKFETIEAMKAVRRGDLVAAGKSSKELTAISSMHDGVWRRFGVAHPYCHPKITTNKSL
jgi:hypothetical protein